MLACSFLELDMEVLRDKRTNLVGNKMKKTIMKFARDERGLTTVEYAVAGGLISAAVVTSFHAPRRQREHDHHEASKRLLPG